MAGKNKTFKVCPKCGSTDIKTDFSDHVRIAHGATLDYLCNSCGFQNPAFPEVTEEELEWFRKQLNK